MPSRFSSKARKDKRDENERVLRRQAEADVKHEAELEKYIQIAERKQRDRELKDEDQYWEDQSRAYGMQAVVYSAT